MGVPLFYSWLLKRYPYIKQESNSNIPYIDCLYMDLNCIIYKCVRDESTIIKDFANAKQFDEIWVSIINSIDRIISMVNPRKLLYLTYDGVAPRAKMNQQRNRRFKSGKSQEKLAAELNKYGITQNQETFINNSITPGTKFMHELNGVMLFYINKKILEDPKWRKIKIIYSGSDVPGEGEHKIFDYIRKSIWNPEFDKLIHCVYGNDADLIMLCLGSHLSNMMILREKFVFKKQISKIKVNDETIKYEWVNINIIRDCFQLEYESIKDNLKHITFDINRIIDDFIFICFFIGNDFLPKLFCFDIKKGYFDELIVLFKDFLINTTDHIISNGILNLQSFESLIQRLSNWELKLINVKVDHAKKLVNDKSDIKHLKNHENNNDEKPQDEEFEIVEKSDNYKEEVKNLEFLEILYSKYTNNKSDAKSFYYSTKLKLDYSKSNYDKINELISKYIQGIQFVLLYYFKGCPSWVWYYSYYYAPMISDVYEYIKYINEQKLSISHFTRGEPFQPFKQLLLVMPKESIKLLPEQYHKLVLDNNSILKNPIDYFPDEFEIDPNDAYYESDYIALLPFVDENILNKAFDSIDQTTLEIDVFARNNQGNNLQFNYLKKKEKKEEKKIKYVSFSKEICNDIEIDCEKIEFDYEADPPQLFTDFFTKNSEISRENNLRDKYEFKLPTLKYFPGIKGKLVNQDKNKVHSVVRLNICSPKVELNTKQINDLNGKDIYVIYPNEKNYLEYNHGKITGYMTENEIKSYDKDKEFYNLPFYTYTDNDHKKIYNKLVKNINFELACQGIEFAENSFNVIFFVDVDRTNNPRKDSFGRTHFKTIELVLPPQLITTSKKCIFFDDIQKSYNNFSEEFPLRNHGIILSNKDNNIIGSIGKIEENEKRKPNLELKIKSIPKQISKEKILSILKEPKTTNYYSLEFVANKLELSLKSILVICDSILIQLNKDYSQKIGEKIDLGLNIISQNYWNIVPELVICSNYNKLVQQNNNDNSFFENLEISEETLNLIVEYHKIFPELFKSIESSIRKKRKIFNFSSDDIFPGDSEGSLKIIKNFTWLLSQKIMGLKLMPLNSQVLSKKQINMLIEKIDESSEEEKINKESRIVVNCNRVILENNNRYFPPKYWTHPQYHEIGDRVINLKTSYSPYYNVPFGKTGTIIGIIDTKIEILFDEPFIGGSNLGGRCPWLRGAIVLFTDVFNLMKERKWDLDIIDRTKTKSLKPVKEWNEYVNSYVPIFLEKIIEAEKINNKELSNQILKIIKRDPINEENKNIEKEENKNKELENNESKI